MSAIHRQAAQEELDRCVRVAAERFGAEYAPATPLAWDARGRVAGLYKPNSRSLHLNVQLFGFDPIHTVDTTAHEYAHAIAHAFYLRTHLRHYLRHGEGWVTIMQALGREARARHALPFQRARAVRRFVMACPCGMPHELSTQRYARHIKAITAGLPGYRCAACKGPLTLIREEYVR